MTVEQTDPFAALLPGEEVDPTENPGLANTLGAIAMSDPEDDSDKTFLIEPPADGTVMLSAGVLDDEGEVVRRAVVRELTGADEEALAKANAQRNITRFVDTLISRAVETIGDAKPSRKMLDALTLGDRDTIVLAIRRVTYGDTIRLDLTCPNPDCSEEFAVDYDLVNDVPMRRFDGEVVELSNKTSYALSAAVRTYTLDLTKGRSAEVAVVDGAAQKAVFTDDNIRKGNAAEMNTLLLAQCVVEYEGMSGSITTCKNMPSADRALILEFLQKAQPGPQYGEVKQACVACTEEFPLVLDLATLFRGI